MRHRRSGRKLGRDASHRKALYANLTGALIEQLLGGVALLGEDGGAVKILLGVREAGFVLCQLGRGLIQRCLEGCGVDLDEEVALPHHLPLLEADLLDLTIHPRTNGHRVGGLHGAEPVENYRERPRLDGGNVNGRALLRWLSCVRGGRAGL